MTQTTEDQYLSHGTCLVIKMTPHFSTGEKKILSLLTEGTPILSPAPTAGTYATLS